MKFTPITCLLACATVAMAEPPAPQGDPVRPLVRSADTVRVSVAQMNITPADLKDGKDEVDLLEPWMKKAAGAKADLLVFPEYLFGSFHSGDAKIQKLQKTVRKYRLNVVVGGWEYLPGAVIKHPPEKESYANCVLVVDREGKIAGRHWKMHSAVGGTSPYCWPPVPGEQGENTMRKGMDNGLVELDFGRIGLLTCYDGYFFESFHMASLRGAEVLVWVNARAGMVEPHIMQAASFMTCTHVVASNQSIGCGSAICSYPGWRLDAAAPKLRSEAFLVADLNLAELRKQRKNNRMFHQRRPEIYGTVTKDWKPWEAYPEVKAFEHPQK